MLRIRCNNHREEILLIRKLEASGFYVINDLLPLYEIMSYLQRTSSLSKQAKSRIKWFDYYRRCKNAAQTCRYFGISRKTFYKWQQRYDPKNLVSLEDRDKAPIRKRQREITPEQLQRIIHLRKQFIRYGKIKLALRYKEIYQEPISSWKIQKVIEELNLYYNPRKTARTSAKRQRAIKKKRITELKHKSQRAGFLLCLDVIVIYWNGFKRYVFTAIDHVSKVAFARMYTNANSYNAQDFLYRLNYVLDNRIENLQTDNGSEFEKFFKQACQKLQIERYYNRPRTPKDNPVNERFNKTLEQEFIQLGNFTPDTNQFNKELTEWLIEYNFRRPHQSLNYETPINFTQKQLRVLPMWSSRTFT